MRSHSLISHVVFLLVTCVARFCVLARMSKKLVGAVDEYDGDRFFTRLGGKGKTVATPLLLCLVCIELSDFVFAVDSIPAVLGISQARSVDCCFFTSG